MFAVALPATPSDKVHLLLCQPYTADPNSSIADTLHLKKPVLGLFYEPTFASTSRAPSHFPSLLFSAPQATVALGRVEPEAPQSLSLWPAGKRSLTDQNLQAQSLFRKKNHSKFKVKQTSL